MQNALLVGLSAQVALGRERLTRTRGLALVIALGALVAADRVVGEADRLAAADGRLDLAEVGRDLRRVVAAEQVDRAANRVEPHRHWSLQHAPLDALPDIVSCGTELDARPFAILIVVFKPTLVLNVSCRRTSALAMTPLALLPLTELTPSRLNAHRQRCDEDDNR